MDIDIEEIAFFVYGDLLNVLSKFAFYLLCEWGAAREDFDLISIILSRSAVPTWRGASNIFCRDDTADGSNIPENVSDSVVNARLSGVVFFATCVWTLYAYVNGCTNVLQLS